MSKIELTLRKKGSNSIKKVIPLKDENKIMMDALFPKTLLLND